ncbi:MAG: thioredoxin family protein [Polyangiaceae bacterium]|nr:thioredoxin family protein [Polyangiaceae bacterium]
MRTSIVALALCLSACCVSGRETDEGLIPPPPGAAAPATTTATPPARTTARPAAPPAVPQPAPAPVVGETWGGAAIAWRTPAEGLAEAQRTGKPVMLVLFTTWCPHCKNYSRVFEDARVAEASKGLVMVRADADKDEATSSKYQPDGGYIPRTFFLKPDGANSGIKASDGRYGYFYDERDPAPLLAAMARAKREITR